jgi:hypothetical protein
MPSSEPFAMMTASPATVTSRAAFSLLPIPPVPSALLVAAARPDHRVVEVRNGRDEFCAGVGARVA